MKPSFTQTADEEIAPPAPAATMTSEAKSPSALASKTGEERHQRSRALFLAVFGAVLVLGALLRYYPSAGYTRMGFDEVIYTQYVGWLEKNHVTNYPQLCKEYLKMQSGTEAAILTPTRFTYPYAAHLYQWVTGSTRYDALVAVSALFSTLLLVLAGCFSLRVATPICSLGVVALMAVCMGQIHQAQHAMIDGFFAFWTLLTLWALWESLQENRHRGWLPVYGLSLAVLVMTKENAFFVFLGILALLASNRWLRFGSVGIPVMITTVAGASAGFGALLILSGGPKVFFEMYRLLVSKSVVLPYAIQNNDGPWNRYLVELLLVSPLVTILAFFRVSHLTKATKIEWFLTIFVIATYLVMANVKLGMNFRYTTIWDMPIRLLAISQLLVMSQYFLKRRDLVFAIAVLAISAAELNQYLTFCVNWPAYALVPQELFRAVNIWK